MLSSKTRFVKTMFILLFLGLSAQVASAVNTVFVQQDTAAVDGTPVPFPDNAQIDITVMSGDIIRVRIWHDEAGAGDIPAMTITGTGRT